MFRLYEYLEILERYKTIYKYEKAITDFQSTPCDFGFLYERTWI